MLYYFCKHDQIPEQDTHPNIGLITSLGPAAPERKLTLNSVCVEHPHVLRGKQVDKARGRQEIFLRVQDQSSLLRNVH